MIIRVISYNLHKGLSQRWFGQPIVSVPRVSDLLKPLSPHLLFLQEVQGQNDHHARRFSDWLALPQHEYMARELDMTSIYASNAHYLHGHHGNALLTKFPVAFHQNHNVSDHVLEQRGILHCQILIDQHIVHCYVVHLGLFANSRKRQVQVLIDKILQQVPASDALIIAGDFNDWQQSLSPLLYEALGVHEVGMLNSKNTQSKHFKTFPSFLPLLSLDRIYYRGLALQHASVLTQPVWRNLSDHRPILAEFKFEKAAIS